MEPTTPPGPPTGQLELALTVADDAAPGPAPEWRLDEHTRLVGRRGVAAARARLQRRPDGPGPTGAEPGHHVPGRAA